MADWTCFDYVKLILTCLVWYLSSAGAGIIGKMILTDFPYPVTVTVVQLLIISGVLGPVLSCVGITKRGSYTRRYFIIMMMPLALGKFMSSLTTFISIWRVSVSYAHTVKATLPLFTVVLAKIILGENQTFSVYLTLLPIIMGVGVTTVTEVAFDLVGLLFALFSTLCCCLLNIFTKKCLKEVGYHHLQLLLIINRLASALFLPVWVLTDLSHVLLYIQQVDHSQAVHVSSLLLCNAVFNLFASISAFSILTHVTPLSYSVANATKRIVVIGGSILVLQNRVSTLNVLGMLMAVFGVLLYNKAKYEQVQEERCQKVLPYVHSDPNLPQVGVPHIPHSKSDADFYTNGDLSHPDSRAPPPPTLWEGEGVGEEKREGFSSAETEASEESASSPVSMYLESPSAVLYSRGMHQI